MAAAQLFGTIAAAGIFQALAVIFQVAAAVEGAALGDDVPQRVFMVVINVAQHVVCNPMFQIPCSTPTQLRLFFGQVVDFMRVHADDCTGKPLMEAEIRKYAGMQDFTDADWDELRAVYLGMCMKIDVQFGKLVEALKEEGIYDDCAIFFLSDHGDFTGDFDLPEKAQNCFEDCLTRVPLLIKPPKNIPLDPGISNSMVELVDFYATAMDLAGVQPTHTHFGHSLRPVLADRSAKVRDYVFCEGGRQPGETHCDEYHRNSKNGKGAPTTTVYWPKMKAQSEDDAHAKGIMMRDERYKYISRTVGKDELYDLQADPQEMTNRIDDESLAPVVVDMQRKMLKWLEATDDIVPFELDERFTPEMLWARVRGLVPPEKEAEVRKMIADGTPFPVLMGYCHSLK